jgi:hypothetical protein
MKKFNYLKILNSPFKPFKLKWYIGKTCIGVPYFFPRKIVGDKFVPLKVGFSSCDLGYKTKWDSDDFRFEWSPVYSFVFFGYQIALTIAAPNDADAYWEAWLYYELRTDKTKSKQERIEQCMKEFPRTYTIYYKKPKEYTETVNKYENILKNKYKPKG